uniref:Uncharacterized protein n=1 Tax=Meloidogyne enterolobii TaxID=390850 RepID=A0A6V7X000_MELEN|nr:unnamed protein product [Meloidogyne enterolobii]
MFVLSTHLFSPSQFQLMWLKNERENISIFDCFNKKKSKIKKSVKFFFWYSYKKFKKKFTKMALKKIDVCILKG